MTVQPRAWPRWPRSLFARLMLILLLGILAAQAMSYLLVMYERGMVGRELMLDNLEKDITSSVAILDRVPAAERAAWLPLIDRKNYRYQLDGGITEQGSDNEIAARVSASRTRATISSRSCCSLPRCSSSSIRSVRRRMRVMGVCKSCEMAARICVRSVR